MAGISSIDKLPEIERTRVLKALAEAGDSPDYRGLVRKLKLKCSHTALWRYHVAKVKPALARNAAAILSSSQDMDITNSHMDNDQQVDVVKESQSLTIQALSDDPIVQAVILKRRRIESAIAETFESKAFDMYAKLESVDLRALEMHAKAMQHPGFVTSAPQQSAGTTVVVVMPTASDPRMQAWKQRQGAIEVVPDTTDSES